MEKKTVNELLVLMKAIRERLNGLRAMRLQVSTKERFFLNREENKVIEPEYNVKALDKKISELELWLFKADSAIKQSNAKTKVDIEIDVDKLLEPLQ